MDALGFALGTAFLASVFTVFGVIDRFVSGLAAEIRYSVAPAMVSGVRAWGRERGPEHPVSPGADRGGSPGDGGESTPDRRDQGLVVPVTTVPRRGWHLFGRLMRLLVASRRRTPGGALGA